MKKFLKILLAAVISYLGASALTAILLFISNGALFQKDTLYLGIIIMAAVFTAVSALLLKKDKILCYTFCTVVTLVFLINPIIALVSVPFNSVGPINTIVNVAFLIFDFPYFLLCMYSSEGPYGAVGIVPIVLLAVFPYVGAAVGALINKKGSAVSADKE